MRRLKTVISITGILLLAALLAIAFWSIGHLASDPAASDDGWSEDGGVTPVNEYVPPVNEEGYCVFEVPPSLLGNKTPEELLEEWREALENVAPECQCQPENVNFRRNKMSFFGDQHSSLYSPFQQLHLPA